jgi:hypothetical protein
VYLRNQGLQWSREVANRAARGGQLHVLRKLHREKCPFAWKTIAEHAARSGSIEVLQYLRQQSRAVFTNHTIYNAACGGHIAACDYLRSEGIPWTPSACEGAARHNHLDTVAWLREQGCPYNHYKTMLAAAEGGSVSILTYLQQHNVGAALEQAQLTRVLNAAGASSQLAAVQWLRAQGAEWPNILEFQLRGSQRCKEWQGSTLTWARSEGCTSYWSDLSALAQGQ